MTGEGIGTRTAALRFAVAAGVALSAIALLGANGAPLRRLAIPVEGVRVADLRNTFGEGRSGRRHEAIDIVAPRGTRVLAVDDGRLAKLFTSVPGGLTVYQFDPDKRFAYHYAHLDRYADGLREGMALRRGDLIGYVGTTGNAAADAPHLHFAVFRLGPEKQWWKGEAVDPFDAFY
jgi:murein DD-endopeptidase MepM/ murein hydrolase activator NlpD